MLVLLLVAWALAVAIFDFWQRRVPNLLLLAVLLPAVIGLIWKGYGAFGAGPWQSLAGASVALVLLLPGYWGGFLGAGDVKYGACIGLLVGGWLPVLWTMVLAGIALGVISIGIVLANRRRKNPTVRIPAAVALSIGFWVICGIRYTTG